MNIKNNGIIIILIVIIGIYVLCFYNNYVYAGSLQSDISGIGEKKDVDVEKEDLKKIVGKILGYINILTVLIGVIIIATTGVNYITGDMNVRKEIKEKMLPMILGLVIVFGAVNITKFFLGTFK